jgi:hypothetical protein
VFFTVWDGEEEEEDQVRGGGGGEVERVGVYFHRRYSKGTTQLTNKEHHVW